MFSQHDIIKDLRTHFASIGENSLVTAYLSVSVAFGLKVSFFHLFEPISSPPPFSLLYFSYSVTSKPSFFKPLPSSSVCFPYFGWKVYGSKAATPAASAAAPPALRSYVLAVVFTDMMLIDRFMSR